jgi:hypothetical protein
MQEDLVPIDAVVPGANGIIAVSQRQDYSIRFFDDAGKSLGSFGRQGGGPGEFDGIDRFGWVADTLWVGDRGLNRLTFVSANQTLIRSVLIPDKARFRGATTAGDFAFDFLIVYTVLSDGNVISAGQTRDGLAALIRMTSDGIVLDTVAVQTLPGSSGTVWFPGGGNASPPFSNIAYTAASPDGRLIVVAKASLEGNDAGTYTVTVVTVEGDTLYHRRYPFSGVEIPRAAADSAIEAMARRLSPANAAIYRREASIPPVYPPLRGVVISSDGSVCVRLRDTKDGRPYVLLDAAGALRGEITLPFNSTVAAASANSIWVLEQDENDVQSIVRYRVSITPGSP